MPILQHFVLVSTILAPHFLPGQLPHQLILISLQVVYAMANSHQSTTEEKIVRGKLTPFQGNVFSERHISWRRSESEGETFTNFSFPIEQLLLAKYIERYCRKFSLLDFHSQNEASDG